MRRDVGTAETAGAGLPLRRTPVKVSGLRESNSAATRERGWGRKKRAKRVGLGY